MGDDTSSRDTRRSGGDKLLGRVLAGRFELVELLARGEMGKIYRANQLDLSRECAIKVLDVQHIPDAGSEFTSRFFREASVAAKLTHPNVVTVFDYGRTDDDVYFIAMELLRGRSLQKALRDEVRMPWQRAVELVTQICRGLRVAHALDVVHRDLKPANIFLVDTGDGDLVKIVDFGLAKLTRPEAADEQITKIGAFMGSARYACPEQIGGGDLDGRADLYALGIILYELITGKVPYDGPNEASVLVAHMNAKPKRFREIVPNLPVPDAVERVVFKMFAHRRDDRYATVGEALQALKAASGLASLLVTANTGPHAVATIRATAATTGGFTRASFTSAPPSPMWLQVARWLAVPPRALWAGGIASLGGLALSAILVGRCVAGASSLAAEEDGAGHVEVSVTGGVCKVAIDGVARGASPLKPVAVQPGMHTVTCTRSNGRVLAAQVRVAAGETASARFSAD